MIYSTLPHLSGKSFTALGIVVDEGFLGLGGHKLPQVFSEIDRQAKSLGADAIIDIKVTRVGDSTFLIMGTAVKFV
jgi:hypothetical protein